ncbi:MAG TPA: MOSC domain-containing protein [Candidatus Sumerlaeota bacterium]|nr:MAG: 6-N-hydroxylaminopurine resistance protein [candidate division BRC1 bacterium ADurb.BinA292]HOE97169.1 MOSC domain-containing protein [Candidatus Sumerlaeota bacterium]HPK01134.1 MOSC domain-containing protein [Candidatus Sumerlaeota bacterium]
MRLVSLNVARPAEIPWQGRMIRTGIFKAPVEGPRRVSRLRIEGDLHGDLSVHGGLDKAVYGYPREHYAFWRAELGAADDFPFGQFGENLTTEGLLERDACLGDVYRIGGALLQISEPRQPCYKLAYRMGRPGFDARFLASGKLGYYFRVLEEGVLQAGDEIVRVEPDPQRVSMLELASLLYLGGGDKDLLERALAIDSLSPKLRSRLARLER